MEIWDLRCSFSSISTSPFLLLRIKPGAGKGRWLDNAWLLMSLSTDCPSAKWLFFVCLLRKDQWALQVLLVLKDSDLFMSNNGFLSPSYDFLHKVLVFSGAASRQRSAADTQGHPPAPVHPWLTITEGFSTQEDSSRTDFRVWVWSSDHAYHQLLDWMIGLCPPKWRGFDLSKEPFLSCPLCCQEQQG